MVALQPLGIGRTPSREVPHRAALFLRDLIGEDRLPLPRVPHPLHGLRHGERHAGLQRRPHAASS